MMSVDPYSRPVRYKFTSFDTDLLHPDFESDSIRGALSTAQVVDVTFEDGRFVIREMADNFYVLKLTREQVIALGHELIAFAESHSHDPKRQNEMPPYKPYGEAYE